MRKKSSAHYFKHVCQSPEIEKDSERSRLFGTENNNVLRLQHGETGCPIFFYVQIALIGLPDWTLHRTHTYASASNLLYFCMKHKVPKSFFVIYSSFGDICSLRILQNRMHAIFSHLYKCSNFETQNVKTAYKIGYKHFTYLRFSVTYVCIYTIL